MFPIILLPLSSTFSTRVLLLHSIYFCPSIADLHITEGLHGPIDWTAGSTSSDVPSVPTPPITPSNIDPYNQTRTSRAGQVADTQAAAPQVPLGWNQNAENSLQALLVVPGLSIENIRETILRHYSHVVNDATYTTFIDHHYYQEQSRRALHAGREQLARSAAPHGSADGNNAA